jgi:hypothetical protein
MNNRFGGLQKTETMFAENFLTDIIAVNFTKTVENQNCSADQVKKSSCEHGMETHCSSGKNLSIYPVSKESTAPFLETSRNINPASFSDRLTPLLISAGLVNGTIPISMRDASGQATLDAVLKSQAGVYAGPQKVVF